MLTRYVLLAFGITWLGVSPLVLAAWGVLPPLPPWLHGLGALGPVVAAALCGRGRKVYQPAGPSALSRFWIGASLATPIVLAALALMAHAWRGGPILAPLRQAAADPEWTVGLAVGSLLYGLGEEPGWRGWLQPYLQERYPAVTATLFVTVIWGVWHAPFFVYRFDFDGPATVVGFFLRIAAGAFWLAFLYNSTSSVQVVAAWHVLWNVANITLAAISATAVGVLNGLMIALGLGIAALFGRRGLRAG